MSNTSLSELRDYVWTYMDLDSDELSSTLLDRFANEATRRIARRRKRWPFFEDEWTVTTVVDQATYALTDFSSTDDHTIDEVVEVQRADGQRLWIVTRDRGEAMFSTTTSSGDPTHAYVWNGQLHLLPAPSEVETLTVYGWRKPENWVSTTQVPDFPEDFDPFFELYMLGRAYQHQEDPDMGLMYLDQAELVLADCLIRYPEHDTAQPLIVNGEATRRGPINMTLLDNWV